MAETLRPGTRRVLPRVAPGHAAQAARRLQKSVGGDRLVELARMSRQPLTAAMVLALAVTSATMAGAATFDVDTMALEASTNLPNLLSRPLQVLFASAFWVPSAWLFWPLAALLVLVIGAAERRLGGLRTVLLFVIGHVGATLVTLAGVAIGVAHGWLPAGLATAVDVGPSYGLATVGAALLAGRTSPRSQLTLVLLITALALALALDRSPMDAGHLIAALLGLLAAQARSARPGPLHRVRCSRLIPVDA